MNVELLAKEIKERNTPLNNDVVIKNLERVMDNENI